MSGFGSVGAGTGVVPVLVLADVVAAVIVGRVLVAQVVVPAVDVPVVRFGGRRRIHDRRARVVRGRGSRLPVAVGRRGSDLGAGGARPLDAGRRGGIVERADA